MKAIRFHAYGGPEVLHLEEIPVPEIQSDEVLIRVHAAGVNFLDAYQRIGLYKTPLPFVPGMEGAGIIEKAGTETMLKTRDPGGLDPASGRLRGVRCGPSLESRRRFPMKLTTCPAPRLCSRA